MANIKIPTILITGKNGQVGWELERSLQPLGKVVALDRSGMDLANPDSIRTAIRQIKPDLIVNAAAYTAVDKAESESALAMAINGVAPGIMAEEAKTLNAAIIHYSTDYVFDGTKATPYTEDDTPNPINVYGKTKLVGERAIQAAGAAHLIFRTSWVYGLRGKNFLLTIRRLAKGHDEIRVVDNQFGAPTWSRMIAETTREVLAISYRKSRFDHSWLSNKSLYHLTASGRTSWYGFALAFLDSPQGRVETKRPLIAAISTDEYPLPAARPQNSCLSTQRLVQTFGTVCPDWRQSLSLCLAEFVPR